MSAKIESMILCDFLLVNNTNLYLAPFSRYCAVLVKLLHLTRVPLIQWRRQPLEVGGQHLSLSLLPLPLPPFPSLSLPSSSPPSHFPPFP